MSFLKLYPCEIILTQMSSLPSNLGWTKLFREKAGWRGEEGELLMEGLARKVFEGKYFENCVISKYFENFENLNQ